MMKIEPITLIVGARPSPLSKAQVEEVFQEIRFFFPQIQFQPLYIETQGDLDRKSSLKVMDKTDFFTREIDVQLLSGACDIAVHSAKDLPDPLPKGLKIIALTRGVDPADSLVMPPKVTLKTLPLGAKVATSSQRREDQIRALRPDLICVEIRGNIHERLKQLAMRTVDGVIVAEAALIRLKLKVNRLKLKGSTAPLQGRLAVVAREDNQTMQLYFSKIHVDE